VPTDLWSARDALVLNEDLPVVHCSGLFLEITMQNMTFALGLRCIDCHEMNDLALDTKPLNEMSRRPITCNR